MKTSLLKLRRVTALMMCVALVLRSTAAFSSPLTLKETLSLAAMMESGASAVSALNYLGYVPSGQNIEFKGDFSESGFSSHYSGKVGGSPFFLNYTGTLTGDVGADMLFDIASAGALGANNISSSAQMKWVFDSASGKYKSASYQENGEINPLWLLVIEIVVLSIEVGVLTYEALNSHVESPAKPPKVVNETLNISGINNHCNKTIKDPVDLVCQWDDHRNVTGSISVPTPGTLALVLAALLGAAAFGPGFKRRKGGAVLEAASSC